VKTTTAVLGNVELNELEEAEELSGKLNYGTELMHSVLENDKEKIDNGRMLEEALNQGIGVFNADVLFEKLVKDYKLAKKLYGEKLIELLSGYDSSYIEKNINIPEFQKEMKKKIDKNIDDMKKDDFLDKQNQITDKGIELASLVLYIEEIEKLLGKGVGGEKVQKKVDIYGDKQDVKNYIQGARYRDISVRKSLKTAVRRGHKTLTSDDLRVFERQAKGKMEILYAMDSSASMKGDKIKNAKKAGVALAYKAVQEKDTVGIIVFGDEVKASLKPTHDFGEILKEITKISCRGQTDISATLRKSVELFSSEPNVTKHLILLTDALATKGDKPESEAVEAASMAIGAGITISIVGINLDKQGTEFAKKIVELGEGKLYVVKDVDMIDRIVLLDYYSAG
jgi:Mg-chelatase subunit ChlD